MGLLDPTLLRNLKGLTGLLAETPIGKYVRGKDQGLSVDGLRRGLLSIPVFENTPEANQTAYEAAMNIGPLGLGKIVYHGSPHKFDKFDASKIGTGEGAQAYGHGVYLADAPDVAQSYTKGGGAFQKSSPVPNVMIGDKWAQTMPRDSLESQAATVFANDLFGATIPEKVKKLRSAKMEPVADFLEKNADQFRLSNGEFYKADLPDEWIPKMLDWDKPVADLTVAEKKALQAAGARFADYWPNTQKVGDVLPKNERAAQSLQKAGIPGIRYLDGGSRGKGQGTYNYVVFPGLEDQVKILERNGVPLGLLGGK